MEEGDPPCLERRICSVEQRENCRRSGAPTEVGCLASDDREGQSVSRMKIQRQM